ncbi:MAG: polysaccharide deacetylase family protein [Ruminococcus sp.]|nr:polysaccharide deacetylase family protein [Ruminococcus sp.]
MNKKSLAILCAAMLMTGCASADNTDSDSKDQQNRTTMEEDIVEPVQGETLSNEKFGYGQGVLVDEENRPTGALDFNAQYSQLGATAIDEESEKILLTFDQGYENGLTGQILDVLKEKNVKAVFFVLLDYAEKNPELVQRMIDEGHTVGNHSVSHYSMPDLSDEECVEEIKGLQEYMQENFDYTPTLFRPPMGEYSQRTLSITQQCGMKTMLWSFAYADWDTDNQPDEAQSLEKLVLAAHKGAIYLLHSVSQTNADILADFIDRTRANGFEFY